jgi:FkbM family methyltransferase
MTICIVLQLNLLYIIIYIMDLEIINTKKYSVKENRYGKLILPKNGSGLCHTYLYEGKVWEQGTIDFINNNSQGLSIISAGTYVGDFLIALHKNCKKIYCFECEPEQFYITQQNIKLNNIKNCILSNKAIGDENTTLRLKVSATGWCGNWVDSASMLGEMNFITKNDDTINTIEVESITLDSYFKINNYEDKISIIQLDIEGYEINALTGAKYIIQKNKPIIIIEEGNHHNSNNEFYKSFLKNLGYIFHDNKVGTTHVFKDKTSGFYNMILYIPELHVLKF